MSVALVNESCDQRRDLPLGHNMPVAVSYIEAEKGPSPEEHWVQLELCEKVRSPLKQTTRKVYLCVLIDGTIQNFLCEVARAHALFCVGSRGHGMEDPICDLVIGNLPGEEEATLRSCQSMSPWHRATRIKSKVRP